MSLTVVTSRLLLLPPAFVDFYKFLFLSLEVLSCVFPCDTVFCKWFLALISRNIPVYTIPVFRSSCGGVSRCKLRFEAFEDVRCG